MKSVALIVTYNRIEKLRLCLQATCVLPFDCIVVVNNASSDGTQQWLSTLTDPRLNVIHLNENIGGAGGFKYGAQYISNTIKTDWIFFFDDDAYPSSNLLENFINLEKENYQLFCSKVVTPQRQLCSMNVPYKKIPHTMWDTIHYALFPDTFLPSINKSCDVQTFSFVGVVIHHKILKLYSQHIHEELFIYFDDLYFSYFLSQLGYKIRYSPELIFTHDVTLNSTIYNSKKLYYSVRNLLISQKIFNIFPPFTKGTIFLRLLKMFFLTSLKGEGKQSFKHFFRGLKDGFSYKSNKRYK
ncbi:glycosyltransferase [Commensalibacter oyaizuii]|uniref:Glycosyltransferase n=1 Tax=Commensalibacter oyaizuii TaxID=3043873 RepID=A0ABT6Q3G2_9PROT|nr:glycosyltransferase [Commensalibacter sp. TBRC 16381]MDI2091533.1 glycosyltransferase [Commensalibacter sp. TBRC 16381]